MVCRVVDVLEGNSSLFGPVLYDATDVLRTIVTADNRGSASPLDNLVKGTDDPIRRQREVDLHFQGCLVVIIDDIEQPEASAVRQLVMHKVHRLDLVDLLGDS